MHDEVKLTFDKWKSLIESFLKYKGKMTETLSYGLDQRTCDSIDSN